MRITQKTNRSHELLRRLLCTICILAIFLVGRNIQLFQVDIDAFIEQGADAQNVLVNMVSGDMYRCSIFALGIMPYMTASILVQFGVTFLPMSLKKRISQTKMERYTLISTFVFSCFLAYSRVMELYYVPSGIDFTVQRAISIIEMVIGSLIIMCMMEVNTDFGIGQQVPIILVNIIEGIYTAVSGNASHITYSMMLICGVIVFITIMMENVEKRIPVQRVSIHNIYADKNYIAFKMNPIGIMPIMFSTSMFMLVKYLLSCIGRVFSDNYRLLWVNAHMDLDNHIGIWIYLLVLFLFSITFSFIMLTPKNLAENLQKGGDSVVGVYAGRPTVRYFELITLMLSVFSGMVLSSCMGISLFLGLEESIPSTLAMLPSSLMILVGIASNIIEEIKGYHKFDSYRFFI